MKYTFIMWCVAAFVAVLALAMMRKWQVSFRKEAFANSNKQQQAKNNPWKGVEAGPVLTLYSQENLHGNIVQFVSEQNNLNTVGFNDMTKSFKLGPYTRVVFYEHPNFQGRSATYENKQDLVLEIKAFKEEHMKGKASSFRLDLVSPYVIAYTGSNRGGDLSKVFSSNIPSLNATWNKKIMSFKLSPFTRVQVFDKGGYKGATKEFTNPSQNVINIDFVGNDWKNKIASMKIEKVYSL